MFNHFREHKISASRQTFRPFRSIPAALGALPGKDLEQNAKKTSLLSSTSTMSCLTFELVVHVFLHLPFHLPLLLLQLHVRVVVALGGGANIAGIIVAAAAASRLPTLLAAVVVAVAALLRGAAASAAAGTVCNKKGL